MVSKIPIHLQYSLHIIYRHPFFNGATADRAPFTFFAAGAVIHIGKRQNRKIQYFLTQLPHNIFEWKELNRFFADATKTGGNFFIKNKKGCDPVTVYFLQTLHMGPFGFRKRLLFFN